MQLDLPLEELAVTIAELDKAACIDELRHVPRLRLDFTDDYLEAIPLEALRHVLLAAVMQSRKHTPLA